MSKKKYHILIFKNGTLDSIDMVFALSMNDAIDQFHNTHKTKGDYLNSSQWTSIIAISGEDVDITNKLKNLIKLESSPHLSKSNRKRKKNIEEMCEVCGSFPMTRSCPDKCDISE